MGVRTGSSPERNESDAYLSVEYPLFTLRICFGLDIAGRGGADPQLLVDGACSADN